MLLSRFCLNGKGGGGGQEFRSLEVRGKLITLKKLFYQAQQRISNFNQIERITLRINEILHAIIGFDTITMFTIVALSCKFKTVL